MLSLLCLAGVLLSRGMPARAVSGLGLSLSNRFDTRACVGNPNSANCNGQFPVTLQGTPGIGSGSCIDKNTKKFPTLFPDSNNPTEEVDLYWSPSCQSYFAYGWTHRSNTKLTIKIIQHSNIIITVDATHDEFFNSEATNGPIQQTEIWSPISYDPTAHVSAQMIVQDANGNGLNDVETPQFVGGIQQTPF